MQEEGEMGKQLKMRKLGYLGLHTFRLVHL